MTSGESHGPALTGIISGLPAGFAVNFDYVNNLLAKRQEGVGRSSRQKIESDKIRILSGVKQGIAIGSPIAIVIENKDYANWQNVMSPEPVTEHDPPKPAYPRPGHADLAGIMKWGLDDSRNVIERASGRTTAMTVALGAVCRCYLREFGIHIGSLLLSFGDKDLTSGELVLPTRESVGDDPEPWFSMYTTAFNDLKPALEIQVAYAKSEGDTLGGSFQVVAAQIPPGLGSCALPDERLDARLSMAVMGIPGIKAVEIGAGIKQASMSGRSAHDQFAQASDKPSDKWYSRTTNLAGGIEGGISNGEPVCITAWMKPLSTINPPSKSLDPVTKEPVQPESSERSDVAAIESAACVAEAAVALELTRAHRDKFGGDTMNEVIEAVRLYTTPQT
jgi:chorismate synthase